MLTTARQTIIHALWERYRQHSDQMQCIEKGLRRKGVHQLPLDHFALIDLPGPQTGIPTLRELFSLIGYVERGTGYLAEKQNDFLWMAEASTLDAPTAEALPQVVVADFRLHELPEDVANIISKYSNMAPHAPIAAVRKLRERLIEEEDRSAVAELQQVMINYCSKRDWPLPTIKEFETVYAFNRLLAWVLVFGRTPNHFTLSLHQIHAFDNIEAFHHYVEDELQLPLNEEGGKIKGTPSSGIMQGSTSGMLQTIQLSDGNVQLPTGFVEFVWRYPNNAQTKPTRWSDYFTGFIAENADRVIESLTTQ